MIFATADEVRDRLRMDATDRDAEFVALCTDAANDLVNTRLELVDQPDPWPAPPPLLQRATIGVAIRIYRFKDAESDVSDLWGAVGGGAPAPLRIPRDPLAGYLDMIQPYVHTWGIG